MSLRKDNLSWNHHAAVAALVAGELHKWGDKYEEAIEATGLGYSALTSQKSVAEKVQFYRRRQNLSFNHHAEVAYLPENEQDKWLAKAEAEGLSSRQLRRAVQKAAYRQNIAEPTGAKRKTLRAKMP